MEGRCKTCGAKLSNPRQTHCSNYCLFANLRNSKSIKGIPIDIWDDAEPWV